MKSTIVNAFIAALWVVVLYAPISLDAQSSRLIIGGSAGVNFSKFKYTGDLKDAFSSSSSLFGLNGGLNVGVEFNKIAILTGAHFVTKGSKYESDNYFLENGSIGYLSATEKLSFITVPLLLRYRTSTDGLAFSIAFGPSINIGLKGDVESLEETTAGDSARKNFPVSFGSGITNDYKKTQVGFMFSPGVMFPVGEKGTLGFNLTFDFGLSSSFNKRFQDAVGFYGDQINRSTMFSISYEHHLDFNMDSVY